MRLSGFSLVCLSGTSLLLGCGPEPTAKEPTPTPSQSAAPAPTSSPSASTPDAPAPSATGATTAAPTATNTATTKPETMPLIGDMSSAEIEKALNDNIKAFDTCYTLGADKQGKLEGTVTIKATIGPLGNVKEATVVKSTTKNPKVDKCVATAFKKVTFPHPKGGVAIITYPMTFGGEMVVKK